MYTSEQSCFSCAVVVVAAVVCMSNCSAGRKGYGSDAMLTHGYQPRRVRNLFQQPPQWFAGS